MADDPVEAARRREAAMLRRSSYFPAANLRQYEGTELSPPGAGTYYNPERYRGAPRHLQLRAQRELAKEWQSDLAFNVMANPRMAQGLEAERIGAQYGGKSRAGQPGYQTLWGPEGGATVVTDSVAKKLIAKGWNTTNPALAPSNIAAAYAKGYGAPEPTVLPGGFLARGGTAIPAEQLTRPERERYGFSAQYGQTFGEKFQAQHPVLGAIGTLGYNALAGLGRMFGGAPAQYAREHFGGPSPVASERGDLLRDTDNIFYGGGNAPVPSPTPTTTPTSHLLAYNEPRRYYDYY